MTVKLLRPGTVDPFNCFRPGQAEVHTSDRILYRRCRRKWNWSSRIRENLEPISEPISALWFGTGIHYALEDAHGHNTFEHPSNAFEHYYKSFPDKERPEDHIELLDLGIGMMSYYWDHWYPRRAKEFQTLWVDKQPQCEVNWILPIDSIDPEIAVYGGTFDRVVVDPYGRLWVLDYKTAKRFDTNKLATDPQCNAYIWAAERIYSRPVEGVVYMQLRKDYPQPPKRLQNGSFSVNKTQPTTWAVYRETLIDAYGSVPREYNDILNEFLSRETPDGDDFVVWTLVRRNPAASAAEAWKITAESLEMLDLNLPLYPNPTRDCSWDCPFRSACLATDDGYDGNDYLATEFQLRKSEDIRLAWRDRINPQTQPTQTNNEDWLETSGVQTASPSVPG